MKWKCTVAAMLLTVSIAKPQDNVKTPWMPLESRIGLALGIGSVTYLDKNASPLIYKSQPKNLRLFYILETNSMLFSIDLDFKIGSTSPKYHQDRTLYFQEEDYKGKKEDKKFPAGGSIMAGRFSLGAFYKIPSTQGSTFKVAVGGRVMDEMFYPQGWSTIGLFNALSFSPEAWTQHRTDDHHSFTATMRIPVVTYLTRLPYDNTVSSPDKNQVQGFLENSAWVSPKKFLAPAFGLGYNYQINQRWGAGLNYDFSWYNMAIAQPMKAISQSLVANLYHQF